MPVNGNDTREIINPPFTTFPYPAVAAIDTRYVFFVDGKQRTSNGATSGIFITPNHVLTAGHSVFRGQQGEAAAIRATTSNIQYTLNSRVIGLDPNRGINVNSTGINYLYNYKPDRKKKDDIALLTTNHPLLPAESAVGIIAFVNPENAIGKTIRTAGYPKDNISLPNYSGRGQSRDLVLSPGSAYPQGRIIGAIEERRFVYSQDVDTFQGQSGSGVWHTLAGDNKPRVLGVHTDGGNNSKGVLITYDAYDQIMDLAEGVSGVIADDLPENAIIGSDPGFFSPITGGGNDNILGTYRKERILGQGGDDNLYGGGADDRLYQVRINS